MAFQYDMPAIAVSTDAKNKGPIDQRLLDEQYTFTNPVTGDQEACNGLEVARRIIASQGKNAGRLRASKPPMDETIVSRERYGHVGQYRTMPLAHAAAAQVWRYVAFEASPMGIHHHMPVMAEFDAPFDMPIDELRTFGKWCQRVADIVLETIPHKPGLMRWSKALGY